MIRKILSAVVLLLLLTPQLKASHYMGGEIWWVCQSNGKYVFHMRAYQECSSYASFSYTTELLNTDIPGLTSITLNFLDTNDISPVCYDNPGFPHITCASVTQPNQGGCREWIYQSAPINLPAGPPPASGWTFYWTGNARNPCANINGTTSMDWCLRAIMFPYPMAPGYANCWDNSPQFSERPSTIICVGYPFSYNPNAWDAELDSLVYDWAQPWTDINAPILSGSYVSGYSWSSPLPGPAQNPNNVAAVINHFTGEVSYTSFTSGAFVTVNKVTAYRCGVKVAEIYRDIQVVLLACQGDNHPPLVIIPYPNGDTLSNYFDTVFAGAYVSYSMWAYDGELLNDTFNAQTIKVTATGLELGAGGISTTIGCLNPPCAQLFWGDTANPSPLPAIGVWALNTQFRWHTDCSHLATEMGCGGLTNTYNFVIRTSDDYCPAPAIRWTTITIMVKNAVMVAPELRCITVEPGGSVKLQWIPPDTTVIPNTWNAYLLFRSKNANGPFTLIDSMKVDNSYTMNSTNYTDLTAHANDTIYYYYLQTRSGCYGHFYSNNSDTLHTIHLSSSNPAGAGIAHNIWNAPRNPLLPSSTGMFVIHRLENNGWVAIDSTQGHMNDHAVTGCGYIKFKITIADSSGCESVSNIDSALFQTATPPDLRCISVEQDGSVTINFLPPSGANTDFFSAYLIYSATGPAGPFGLVDSINLPNILVKNINAINANQNSQFVYMINRIDCDGYFFSDPSDTLKSMHLDISTINQERSSLAWNEIHTPALPTTGTQFDVVRQHPAWQTIFQSSILSAFDSLSLCNDTVRYRIEVPDISGCRSVSNISGAHYWDDIPPPVPRIDSVSVDSVTGFVHISWFPNGPQTAGYVIFYSDNGNWIYLDTIWGTNQTYFLDKLSPGNGCDAPKSYVIAAVDSCGNPSAMSIPDVHNTITLRIAGMDPCASKISLSWNPYPNMKDTLAGYKVFATENGGTSYLLGLVLPGGLGQPVPTTFVHENFTKDSYYCYYVQAFNTTNTITSTSCRVCILAVKPKQPQFIYLRYASVETNNKIKMEMFVDTSAYVTEYRILRATEKAGPFELVGTLQPNGTPDMEFIDSEVNPLSQSYYYTINVVDSCGLEVLHSDTTRTILLAVGALEDFTNLLEWNDYEGWTWTMVRGYNIYRGIDGLSDPIPIVTVPFGTLHYSDDVSMYFNTQGKFRYYIEALQAIGIPDFNDTSYSNRANDVQSSMIYIPNAFSPKGYNSIFKPVSIFADKSDYLFQIYNRWGELVFETRDPNEGWNGTYKGDYVPVGVFIYHVRFRTSTGQKFEKRSTVTVIK
ncbi:MAG: gliding motility-associated C-terminal domain-containing protein [Bacteroidetes bacterium]|nr:gliding motility-associated C-terminal domain-containing protein [Bacteroidota bacterium]